MKPQTVRIADVLLVGPLMLWGGTRLRQEPAGVLLAALGLATVAYNATNYLKARGQRIPGGLARGRRASDFNPRELRRGAKVEMEHTDDPDVAREIAMDHLVEDPKYYTKLARAGL